MRAFIYLSLLSLYFLLPKTLIGQQEVASEDSSVLSQTQWVNQKMESLSLDQKLGQLFMVAAYSNKGEGHTNEILQLVKQEEVGGLIFFQGTPKKQAELTNLYNQAATTPLWIAMDAEWGLSMRLPNVFKYPWPLTVGAIQDTAWAYQYGKAIAEQCKRLGVHVNFAPVVDINTNPNNPIINARSFGENPQRVTEMSLAYIRGLQSNGVMACAKHFPGHGDTDSDSHKTLPTVNHTMERLEQVELYPYRQMAKSGLGSVMVAHLNVPALDGSGGSSSLSKPVIDFLKKDIGFNGLIFTDALNMKAVSNTLAPGEVDLQALLAGNDVLLFAENVPAAKKYIKQALIDSLITLPQIEASVRKILMAKHKLNAHEKTYVNPVGLSADLDSESDAILNRQLFENATTVLINHNKTIPVRELGGKKIACITAGTQVGTTFKNTLKNYTQVEHFEYSKRAEREIMMALADYDLVIFGIYSSNKSPWKSYKINAGIKSFVKRVSLQNKLIINVFANPYSLKDFKEAEKAQAVIMSYQNHPDAESVAAQVIFGALGAKGSLPVTASPTFEEGLGLYTPQIGRMGYAYPGEVGLDEKELSKIDLIVKEAIAQRATPGAQVLVARHGKVVYHRAFGHHTYKKKTPVNFTDVYDIASITKIAATVPVFMKLVEEGKIDLDKTLGYYLPEAKGTNKEDLILRDILTHQARLKPWIPFYTATLEGEDYKPGFYNKRRNFNYPHTVTQKLYSQRYIRDTILKRVLQSPLRPNKEYKYSDLGYYLFLEIIEKQMGQPLNELVYQQIYRSLGAYSLMYNPLFIFDQNRVVPTEDDEIFRKTLVHGYVHDQGAALLGGVAGHAGLFSSANDLAKLMQMYLQKGEYAGIQYFDSVTVNEFIRCQYCDENNRRGIGFDKPQLEGPGPTCGCVSSNSFGHSGFTGTLAWADPDEEIVYIFLSNRVHPDASNKKLLSLSTRTRIQSVIYDAIKTPDANTTLLSSSQH